MSKLERDYQQYLIKRLYRDFDGCLVMKNDPNYLQGILDLTILYKVRWAMLDVKADRSAPLRPNQGYYVDLLNSMSYAAIIHPGNEEDIFRELKHALRAR